MLPDPVRARSEIEVGCVALARFHPSMGGLISDCAIELAMLATVAGDKEAALSAARLVAAAADHGGGSEQVALAVGYRQLAEGDTRAAAATFAAAANPADETSTWWWRKYMATEVMLGNALTQIAADDKAGAKKTLEKLMALHDQLASAIPQPIYTRRKRVFEQLVQGIAVLK